MKGPWQWQELARRWPMGLLLLLSLHASGQNLTLADPSASALQTRTFEHTDSTALIRSSLAIIQDISFHVIEAESSPVMLVAVSPGADTETLTISLREDVRVAGSYSIRLSLAAPWISENSEANGENFEEKFYQDFFSYLHRELFREASLP